MGVGYCGTLGIQEIGQYLQIWLLIQQTTLLAKPDDKGLTLSMPMMMDLGF
jgi:hypothetical protein